ncbi:helix-turn-helix transcriptional regulator [Streptomyces sp. ISL-12]|uniref:helix-turn-helix domain-containing protein n=1 Tax=Streptomyces sp. ISL-12 TaxID=2819177 RepID=UPI001BEAFEB7|nr:helix-turn-helix transcriptional regulator [Streptomyces sp. ISL-12]MBT2411622.1 helix-turn-helix transcriptional regulator [Streptomyces sp. ISL-12]
MDEWDVSPEDGEATGVIRTVARQLKLWRESAGLTQPEFGAAIGYGEELVSSVERMRRIPRPEYLEAADKALKAGGKIAALKKDLADVRYPKKVRDVKRLEAEAVEICSYNASVIDGLLQTEAYARTVFSSRRPPFTEQELERQVSARLARQTLLGSPTAKPLFNFVTCEATLRRLIGGKMVMREQLERLLEVARLRNVDLQVLPLACEENSGIDGSFRLLKLRDGSTVGLVEAPLTSRVLSDPRDTTVLDVRYGMIRAQALTPRESLALIEKLRGET